MGTSRATMRIRLENIVYNMSHFLFLEWIKAQRKNYSDNHQSKCHNLEIRSSYFFFDPSRFKF